MLSRALRSAAAASTRRAALLSSTQRGFASYPPHEVVGLPALSPTMEQGNLASWRLKEGDKISAGDIICQIETDKAVVDYEAQDDAYLAKILVPEGTENISIGQPIMVTCEEEEYLSGLKDFKLDDSFAVAPPAPKAPEEVPPKKDDVPLDATKAPVAPQDFLVTAQTTHKVVQGTPVPPAPVAPPKPAVAAPAAAPVTPAAAPSTNTVFSEKWGHGIKKSPISFSLAKKQQAYINLYGLTGTTPVFTSKD